MSITTTAPQKAGIKVGIIFITEPIQLLDVAPIDILGMMEPSYLRALGMPETFCAKGIEFEYHYVNETGKGPNQMSAGFKLAVTVTSPSFFFLPDLLQGKKANNKWRPGEGGLGEDLRTQYILALRSLSFLSAGPRLLTCLQKLCSPSSAPSMSTAVLTSPYVPATILRSWQGCSKGRKRLLRGACFLICKLGTRKWSGSGRDGLEMAKCGRVGRS